MVYDSDDNLLFTDPFAVQAVRNSIPQANPKQAPKRSGSEGSAAESPPKKKRKTQEWIAPKKAWNIVCAKANISKKEAGQFYNAMTPNQQQEWSHKLSEKERWNSVSPKEQQDFIAKVRTLMSCEPPLNTLSAADVQEILEIP